MNFLIGFFSSFRFGTFIRSVPLVLFSLCEFSSLVLFYTFSFSGDSCSFTFNVLVYGWGR